MNHKRVFTLAVVFLATVIAPPFNELSITREVFASNRKPEILTPGNGTSSPVLRRFIAPRYPDEAVKRRFGGSVLLAIVVDEKGDVINAKVNRALGLGTDEEALAAVKLWQFTPAQKGGTPVKVFIPVEITFDKGSGRTGGAVLDWSDAKAK